MEHQDTRDSQNFKDKEVVLFPRGFQMLFMLYFFLRNWIILIPKLILLIARKKQKPNIFILKLIH